MKADTGSAGMPVQAFMTLEAIKTPGWNLPWIGCEIQFLLLTWIGIHSAPARLEVAEIPSSQIILSCPPSLLPKSISIG
jgi:hypothetical protein